MPAFFVPMVDQEKWEEAYADLAKFVGSAPQEKTRRIYSMTWRHDGVEWTATVGESLRGTEQKQIGRGRNATHREIPRRTADTVLAIFPGVSYMVAHDNKSRVWNQPIYTGEPLRVVFFDQ